ncbi:MAG: hypothetical protein JWM32_1018 [Verrucomicrobia bacterium]|nr:hypothetical protein [Verrucomicrobiota bacterium]
MKSPFCSNRIVLLLIAAASAALCAAAASPEGETHAQALPAAKAAPELADFKVQGIMTVSGVRYASIGSGARPGAPWMQVGETFSHFVIEKIDDDAVTLARRDKDERVTLPWKDAVVKDAAQDAAEQPYTKRWINSHANPMLYNPTLLPHEVARDWANLSKEERDAIIDYYLKHGWKILYSQTVGGSTNFALDNIYEKERVAAQDANREAFSKMLTPEQLDAYNQVRSTKSVNVEKSSHEEVKTLVQERKTALNAFTSTLTPAQSSAYQSIRDFTKADWSK